MGVWRKTTLSQENISTWPEEGDKLDLEDIPVVHNDEDGEETCGDLNENVINRLFADGDNQPPAPLKKLLYRQRHMRLLLIH